MESDPLSEVLALVKPRFAVAAALDAGGAWSIGFPGGNEIRFQAVISGACLFQAEGERQARQLGSGDCFISVGQPFRIGSDLDTPAVPAFSVFSAKRDGVASHNGGGAFLGLGCLFSLEVEHARMLRELLPCVMHISNGDAGRDRLRASLEQLAEETRRPQPGSRLVTQHLSQMMLIQALRLHMAGGSPGANGWLAAFKDRRLSQALAAMHHSPERNWTLQSLALSAGMSRTSFSLHFKEMVGVPPMDYLTRWRMLRAAERLQDGREPVSEIARAVGYASESAFGVAFKRIMGRSPRQRARDPA